MVVSLLEDLLYALLSPVFVLFPSTELVGGFFIPNVSLEKADCDKGSCHIMSFCCTSQPCKTRLTATIASEIPNSAGKRSAIPATKSILRKKKWK